MPVIFSKNGSYIEGGEVLKVTDPGQKQTGLSNDVIRGSSDIPLNAEGKKQAKDLAGRTANQFDKIYSSDLKRAADTAHAIADTNPEAGPPILTKALHPWHLGEAEGQPTSKVLSKINDYIKNKPNIPIPGRGERSTHDGESFNNFKHRFLGHVKHQMKTFKEPQRILNVTHYRGIRLLDSWLKAGAPGNETIDTGDMTKQTHENPGELFYLHPGEGKLQPVDYAGQPGIYFARHGKTIWNGQVSPPQDKG